MHILIALLAVLVSIGDGISTSLPWVAVPDDTGTEVATVVTMTTTTTTTTLGAP